jgi:hypothetical protein
VIYTDEGIGGCMPTDGIRGVGLIWAIKTIKWGAISLNGFSIDIGITFVFMLRRFLYLNAMYEEEKKWP